MATQTNLQRENASQLTGFPSLTLAAAPTGIDGSGFHWMREALLRTHQTLESLSEVEELHRLLFENVPYPRFVCEARTLRILAVNEAAIRQYGYSRAEFLGMKITQLSPRENSADFQQHIRRVAYRKPLRERTDRLQKRDGTVIDVKIDVAGFFLRNKRVMFLLMAEDVTNKRRADQRLRIQQAVTQALAESSTLVEAAPKIFQAICQGLECDWGELWRVDAQANLLRCVQTWHPAWSRLVPATRAVEALTFARGEGIAGTVWLRNKPIWITDFNHHDEFQRLVAFAKQGLRTVVAFPIRLNREVLGVVTFFSRQSKPPDKHLLQMLRNICSQIGQVMGRRRAERQLLEISEREQQRIGQDLHDGLCQQLVGIAYLASNLESQLAKLSRAESAMAARIAELSRETAAQARQIARGLNPVKVGKVGLVAALHELTTNIHSMFSIVCRFECPRPIQIADHETAVHLYRITQEAIHNAITHGKASAIVVALRRRRSLITLQVKDNGRGLSRAAAAGAGMGMENMNYRARGIGAQITLKSRRGGGTMMNCAFSQSTGRST